MIVDTNTRARQFDVLLEVDRVLSGSCYSALRGVTYGLFEGRIVLEGTVPSWYMKQTAQSLVLDVAESHPVDNQIAVDRHSFPRPFRIPVMKSAAVPA